MTIIDTTLYCNGELRLARHGAGRGGTVLVHTATGKQFTVPDNETDDLVQEIGKVSARRNIDPEDVFDTLKGWFEDVPVIHF
jgi:hypothetical protein